MEIMSASGGKTRSTGATTRETDLMVRYATGDAFITAILVDFDGFAVAETFHAGTKETRHRIVSRVEARRLAKLFGLPEILKILPQLQRSTRTA